MKYTEGDKVMLKNSPKSLGLHLSLDLELEHLQEIEKGEIDGTI